MTDLKNLSKEDIKNLCDSRGIEISQCLRDIEAINMEIISKKLSKSDMGKIKNIMSDAEELIKTKGIINETAN